MLKFLFVLLLITTSFSASAARQWEITNNYIKKVQVYSHPVNGTNFNVIRFILKNPVNFGCAASDSTNSVSYWQDAPLTDTLSSWIAVAMAAQAQGLPVDIYTEKSVCSINFGRQLMGISLSAE